jgi:aryl-alcohol dehydrogenase-like predicted oxidoreductase
MKYSKLGRTGLKVSKLCLGTMNFGVGTDEQEAFRIMDAALDAGINFFDHRSKHSQHYAGSSGNPKRMSR